MNKKFLKGFVSGILITLMITSVTFAAPVKQALTVYFNNIKFVVDDVSKPVQSNQFFVYNGDVYGNMKTVAGAIGKKYNYDSKTGKLFINNFGNTVKEYRNIYLYKKPYTSIQGIDYINVEDKLDTSDKKTHRDVYFYDVKAGYNLDEKLSEDGFHKRFYHVEYALNGFAKTTSLSFGSYNSDSADNALSILRIYDENNKVLYTSPLISKTADFININVETANVMKLKLEVEVRGTDWYDKITPVIRDLNVLTKDY